MCGLNRMVTGICYKDLPRIVAERAKHSILDTLAVIIGSSSMEGISLVVDYVKEKGGNPQSVLPFYGVSGATSRAWKYVRSSQGMQI